MSDPLKVFIIAGEPSGDKLGGALMAGLAAEHAVRFEAVGGPNMAAQGLESLFDMGDLDLKCGVSVARSSVSEQSLLGVRACEG